MRALEPLTKPTLLIVEDSRTTGRALTRTFKSKGYDVAWVQASASALEVLRQRTFNVIIADLRMAQLQGVEQLQGVALIHELAREAGGAPIIVFSGYLDVTIAVECMRAGAFNIIMKTEATEKIVEAVQEATSAERRTHPTTSASANLKLDVKTLFCTHLERATTRWNLDLIERDVLGGIISDKTTKQLADELGRSTRWVDDVIKKLFVKAVARSRTELINKFWVSLRD